MPLYSFPDVLFLISYSLFLIPFYIPIFILILVLIPIKVPGQRLVYRFDKLPYNYKPGLTSIYQEQLRNTNTLDRKKRYLQNIHDHCYMICSQPKVQILSTSPVLQGGKIKCCSYQQPKLYYPDSYFHYSTRCSCIRLELLQTCSVPSHRAPSML